MKNIAIVYWSGTGNTEAMANALRTAVTEAGAEAALIPAEAFAADQVAAFDALAFGCPAMGAEKLEEDVFEPMFASVESALAGKKVFLFGSYGWGDGQWMRDWEDRCRADGADLAAESVICTDAPQEDTLASLHSAGAALVES